MRFLAATLTPIFLGTIAPAAAQDHSAHETEQVPAPQAVTPDPHAGHDMSQASDTGPQEAPPSAAGSGVEHAADLYFDPAVMARAREQLRIENGEIITHAVIFDQLEATLDDDQEGYSWDAQGWYGGDIHRFWWKSEGEGAFNAEAEEAELQLLYSRAVTPYFDVQAGVRQTYRPEGDRTDLVLGVQGLAPHLFDVDASAFVSNKGELTARAQAEYDLRLTQRLILQPRAEINLSAEDIPEFAIGAGVSSVQVGARLRYEIRREFAPYVGVEWTRGVGETRDMLEARGDESDSTRVVVGLRTWF